MPCPMIADTAWLAASMLGKAASSVATLGGRRSSRTLIFVIAQSVPSEPTNNPQRSRPTRSGASPLTQRTLPSASTTSMPSTWLVVTP